MTEIKEKLIKRLLDQYSSEESQNLVDIFRIDVHDLIWREVESIVRLKSIDQLLDLLQGEYNE
jgi:hypothetical protein